MRKTPNVPNTRKQGKEGKEGEVGKKVGRDKQINKTITASLVECGQNRHYSYNKVHVFHTYIQGAA